MGEKYGIFSEQNITPISQLPTQLKIPSLPPRPAFKVYRRHCQMSHSAINAAAAITMNWQSLDRCDSLVKIFYRTHVHLGSDLLVWSGCLLKFKLNTDTFYRLNYFVKFVIRKCYVYEYFGIIKCTHRQSLFCVWGFLCLGQKCQVQFI